MWISKFKASLVYRNRTTKKNLVLKNQTNQTGKWHITYLCEEAHMEVSGHLVGVDSLLIMWTLEITLKSSGLVAPLSWAPFWQCPNLSQLPSVCFVWDSDRTVR